MRKAYIISGKYSKKLSNFKWTLGFLLVIAAARIAAALFSKTVCVGGRFYYPGQGYRCDATAPDNFGELMLLIMAIGFLGMIISFCFELLRWHRRKPPQKKDGRP